MSQADLIGVFGTGGCGRGVMPLLRAGVSHPVFVEDIPRAAYINGTRVLGWAAFCASDGASKHMVLAVADPAIRKALAARCTAKGIRFASVRAANAVVMDEVEIGEGAILCPFVTITANVRIGRHFHANLYSYVEHDCEIGDFVTFAPRVSCNGNVRIEDHVFIGAGAIIRQGTPGKPLVIGRGAVIGMGAVVTKDVAAGETVVGNPARPLDRR